jgi:membrane protease YdiL (CAAX protease family)
LQPTSPQRPLSRLLQLALFVVGILWVITSSHVAAIASEGLTSRLNIALLQPLLQQAFWLFLLLIGFAWLGRPVLQPNSLRRANALPARPTTGQEWQRGFALGWAMALIAVLPMVILGALHPQFALGAPFWLSAAVSIPSLALAVLAVEVAFRGFLFARLIAAIGTAPATVFMALLFALFCGLQPNATPLAEASAFFAGILLSLCYLRTHALWLGWGLHFAWGLTLTVFLGLPIAGSAAYTSLVVTNATGPDWLTGGAYGPEAALFTLVVLIAAILPLYRITRTYAWEYTLAPILPMGQAVVIAPPAAHTAMEEAAAASPAPLVQILASTPAAASTLPEIQNEIKEHLRSTALPGSNE